MPTVVVILALPEVEVSLPRLEVEEMFRVEEVETCKLAPAAREDTRKRILAVVSSLEVLSPEMLHQEVEVSLKPLEISLTFTNNLIRPANASLPY